MTGPKGTIVAVRRDRFATAWIEIAAPLMLRTLLQRYCSKAGEGVNQWLTI